jgi:predicted AAA+ superfamily ATPase
LFEQMIGLELVRLTRLADTSMKVLFWRDPDGPEVDWIVDREGALVPIETKLTDTPSARDVRHVEVFLREYRDADRGYLACRTPRRVRLSNRVTAVPWQALAEVLA